MSERNKTSAPLFSGERVLGQAQIRQEYEAPCIVSAEPLEAAAAGGCDDPGFGLGKSFPPCTTLGS